MAKPLSTIDSETASSTSFTPTAPPSFSAGDAICLLVLCQNTSNDITTAASGWVVSSAKGTYGNNSLAAVYKLNVSGSESMPSLTTAGSAADWYCTAVALTDVPTSAAVDIETHGATGGSGLTQGIPTATTGATNTLGLWMCATNNWAETMPEVGSGVLGQDKNLPSSETACGVSSGWWFEESSGVTSPSRDFWLLDAVRNRHAILISFKSDTGIKPARCDIDTQAPWDLVCGFYDDAGYKGYSFTDVTTDVTAIDGITTYNASGADNRTGFGLNLYFNNYYHQPASSGVGRMHIREITLDDAPYDATNKRLFFHCRFASGTDIIRSYPLADHGVVIGLRSGTSGSEVYRFFDAIALDTIPASDGMQIVVIDPTDTTNRIGSDIGGTFDESDIRGIVPGVHQSSTQSVTVYFTHCGAYNKLIGIGGDESEGNYLDWAMLKGMLKEYDQSIQNLGNAYESKVDIQIGNGSSETHFNTNGQNFSFPNPADFTSRQIQYQVYDSPEKVIFQLDTGDTARFDAVMDFKGGELDLSDAGNVNATWTWAGGTWKDVGTWNVSNIGTITNHNIVDSADMVDLALRLSTGVVLSNTKVSYSDSVQADLQTKLNLIGGASLDEVDLTFTAASDIALTLPANTDIATLYFENTAGDHTCTLTVPDSSSVTSSSAASGDTLTIEASVDTFRVESNRGTTTIRRYADDSQTPAGTGTGSLDFEFPDTTPIDIDLVEQGYVPVNRQNVIPSNSTLEIEMDFDEAYNASHGLTITSQFDYNRTTKALTINSDQSALDVRSALADTIRTNSSYYNTKLLMEAIPGLTRVDLIDGATITSMATWKGAGMERFDAADSSNPVEKWFAIKSVGAITGATVHYRQTDSGDSTAITLTNNVVDEAFQYYRDDNHDGDTSDTNEYDYSGYMVIKSFLAGSKQGRVDVVSNAGVSALASNLYTVPLANTDHDYSGTDPGISSDDITLVAGGTVGGKTFAYEIVDGGTNTGQDIADQLNYNAANNPNTVIPGGTGLRYFELPDMVIHNATGVETERGYRDTSSTALVGFYVSRGGSDHPDFTRFQADDGTYYVPTVQLQATVSNLPTAGGEIRLQIHNNTTATEIYNADPGSSTYNATYTEGGDYTEGDEIRVRFAELNGTTSFKSFETVVTATASGWSLNANNVIEADPVYATNAVDGSLVTKFNYSAADDHFNLVVAQNWSAPELFAFYCMTLTTSTGIEGAFGAFTAIDAGNYRNNTAIASIYLDNETTATQRQTDSARVYRDDEAYPVLDPTTSGYGIDVNWKNVVYVVSTGGSALTASESAHLLALPSATQVVDEMESQMQADPTGFHVNVKEINGAEVAGSGTSDDKWR